MVDIGVLQCRLRIIEHDVHINGLRRQSTSELVKYAFPLYIAILFRRRELSKLRELAAGLGKASILEVGFYTGASSFIISFHFAEVDVSQNTPRLPIDNANLRSTHLCNHIVIRLRVGLNSEPQIVSAVFSHVGRSESHVVDLLVTACRAHRLKIPMVVHVDIWRLEPLLCMVDIICTPRWAVIEFIDIERVEVLGNVDHFGLFLVTLF